MSKFQEALKALKKQMEAIKGGPMSFDETGLSNKTDSEKTFVHMDLLANLPKEQMPAAGTYTLPSDSPYSDNVLQAIWNIAHCTQDIGTYSIKTVGIAANSLALKRNFDYLSSNSAPKVIDRKTHQAAVNLIKFLEVATTDTDALKLFPESAIETLKEIQGMLKVRVDIYQRHTAEHVKRLPEIQTLKNKAEPLKIELQTTTVNELIIAGKKILQTPLTPDLSQIEMLEGQIELRQKQRDALKKLFSELEDYNQQWLEKNKDVFPDGNVSAYFEEYRHAEQNPEDFLNVWRALFNTITLPNQVPNHNPYQSNAVLIENAKARVKKLDDQIAAFESKREAIKDMTIYEQQITEAVTKTPDLELPEFLTNQESGLGLKITLSTSENMKTQLETNRAVYADTVEKLKQHAIKLEQHHTALTEQYDGFEIAHPLPSGNAYVNEFVVAREKAMVQLLERITVAGKQRDHIQELIIQTASEHTKAKEALGKLSKEGQNECLVKVAERIGEALQANEQAQIALLSAKQSFEELPSIDNSLLARLEEQAVTRRRALETAAVVLEQYEKDIAASDMYVPSGKVPKEKLLGYLEDVGGEELTTLINKMYQQEQQAGAWYGVNLSHFWNKMAHHASVFDESDFEADLNTLENYISLKRQRIEAELSVDITKPGESPKNQSPDGNNLYRLRDNFQHALEPGARKLQQKEKIEFLDIEVRVTAVDHVQAMLQETSFKLEFRLEDVKTSQGKLAKLSEQLSQLDPSSAYDLLNENMELLSSTQDWLTTKVDDKTTAELIEVIDTQLKDIDQHWVVLEEVNINPLKERVSADLQEKIQALRKERDGLVQQKLKAETQFQTLVSLVNDVQTKQEVLQVQILTQLATNGDDLKSRIENSSALSLTGKQTLLEDINKHLVELQAHDALLLIASTSPKEELNQLHQSIRIQGDVITRAQQKLESFIAVQMKKISPTPTPKTQEPKASFATLIETLEKRYFTETTNSSEEAGIFVKYLAERSNTFSWRDFFSQCAAFLIGCTGYRTEKELREEYISDLKEAVNAYKSDTSSYENLNQLLETGITKFAPRDDTDKTLRAKLTTFKSELASVHEEVANTTTHTLSG